jgi:hypothetical protein
MLAPSDKLLLDALQFDIYQYVTCHDTSLRSTHSPADRDESLNMTTLSLVRGWMLLALMLASLANAGVARADELFPKPLTTRGQATEPFVLAGPDVKSVIIAERDPDPYMFPYWGGHAILQRYLEVVTGIAVPVVTTEQWEKHPLNVPSTNRIWVGSRTPQVKDVLGADLAKLDDDGFIIRVVGSKDLYISGRNFRGTHFAPYDLLERAAGCRWYLMPPRFWMPKEDGNVGVGDVLPKARQVAIPGNTDVVEEPSYKMRFFRITPEHSFRLWPRDKFHHALVNILPPDKLGKTNPEYFPLIDGKRFIPESKAAYNFQPCISNPNVTDLMVQAAGEAFAKGDSSFSLGMNDSNKYCQCDACKKLAPDPIKGDEARIAYSYIQWYNEIARRLEPKYSDRRIGILAYATLSAVPAGSIKLHPMIVPYLTRDSAQLFDANEVIEFRETVNRWAGLAQRMGIYEYLYGQGFYIPRIYNRYLFTNIKDRYGVGCDGFYAEAYPQWSLDGPKYWMTSKLLWNHRLDVQSLYRDYYQNMFGPAADAMRAYFDFLEEAWCTQTLPSPRSNYRWMNDSKQLEIFPPQTCEKGLQLIDAALALTQGPDHQPQRQRIEFFRKGFEFTTALSRRYHLAKDIEQVLTTDPLSRAKVVQMMEAWLANGTTRQLYDLRKEAQLDQTSNVSLRDFNYHWSSSSPIYRAANQLTNELSALAVARMPARRSLDVYYSKVDDVLAQWQAIDKLPAPQTWAMLRDQAKASGVLFVRDKGAAAELVIDGRIDPKEWGDPVYQGNFNVAYIFGDRSPNLTTIYACDGGDGKIFLAIDAQQDPQTVGGHVTNITQDQTFPFKMAQDDAIVINVSAKGRAFETYRINSLGVWAAPKSSKSSAAATRTPTGWQAEWVIESDALTKASIKNFGNPKIAIARYERSLSGPKGNNLVTQCTTLRPVGRISGTIGNGNHDDLMAFVWGPELLFESSQPAKP